MSDLEQALADITHIKSQLAAGTMFRGFGPMVIAATASLAAATSAAQLIWVETLAGSAERLLTCWIVTAVVCAVLIATEMIARSRRHHGGLSTAMILNAIEQFLPAGFAGCVVAAVFFTFAPDGLWLLPGLWQILVALGLFAALRSLPRAAIFAGAWYFLAGAFVLIIASQSRTVSPLMMGVPFAIGQSLLAAVLHFATE
ncbi:MAG: hypothetical protein HY765_04785 [Rhodomicrobium sp.]|nr:hypothetical protein [Rhodomicrobium sp.]